jgi:hypothetical protein
VSGRNTSIKPNQSRHESAAGGLDRGSANNADAAQKPESLLNPALDNDDAHDAEVATKLPLWPTMGLFASLAANLFFGWIAWDTHSRYQDFVEETNQGDVPRERQTRRPRPDKPARRTHEKDEAELVKGGFEV